MSEINYTPDQLRAQIEKMWLRKYPDGPTDQNWLLNVGIGAGMLMVAADRIEALEAALRSAQSRLNGEVTPWLGVRADIIPSSVTAIVPLLNEWHALLSVDPLNTFVERVEKSAKCGDEP